MVLVVWPSRRYNPAPKKRGLSATTGHTSKNNPSQNEISRR